MCANPCFYVGIEVKDDNSDFNEWFNKLRAEFKEQLKEENEFEKGEDG